MKTSIKDYIETDFQHQLRGIPYQKPNRRVRSNAEDYGIDEHSIFFGDLDWRNFEQDCSHIPTEQKEWFIVALFTLIVIDLNMHAHFYEHYPLFRSKTMYPKFGRFSWGHFHYEKPKKLLRVPAEKEGLTFSGFDAKAQEYADYFFDSFERFFSQHGIPVTSQEFFTALLNDVDFQVANADRETVFEKIYNSLKQRVS